MGWATGHIAKLRAGETVSFRPRGNSMSGKIESGQLCTVTTAEPETLEAGDIVRCKVNGREYLHLIKAVQGQRFQIGNNRGRINGWVTASAIFGKCVAVEVRRGGMRHGVRGISPLMPPDEEHALRARVTEQARLEQAGDISGLCDLILPAYRTTPAELSKFSESFGRFVPY
jgi:hypothetical protein